MSTCTLETAETPIREALQRLAESPIELRCFVIIEEPTTGRFVQFCTPPPPSPFAGSPRLQGSEPLIFDGFGILNKDAYQLVQTFVDVDTGTRQAIDVLATFVPDSAELTIREESSTKKERSS